jgi:glucosamine-6-phosphate deaminase
MTDLLEHFPIKIYSDESNDLAIDVACSIADEIQKNNTANKHTVLVLETGAIVIDVYRELISLYEAKKIDFSNTIVFNHHEYYGMPVDHPFTIRKFLQDVLLSKINVKEENVHFLDSSVPEKRLDEYMKKFDEEIYNLGGIDVLLLGVGDAGHAGFNSPCTSKDSKTKLINLDKWLLIEAIPDFSEMKYIPKRGLAMGLETMLNSKKVLIVLTGDNKTNIVKQIVEGPLSESLSVTYFQKNKNTSIYIDEAASAKLSRKLTPWFVQDVDWRQQANRVRAVCHLSEFLGKSINELQTKEFLQYSLKNLVKDYSIGSLTREVMNVLESKVVSNEGLPKGLTVVVFSPHPDDDIISMGGTLLKLVENRNKVYCIYMTPGTNAVFDHEVEKFVFNRLNFAKHLNDPHLIQKEQEYYDKVIKSLKEKASSPFGMKDTDEVKFIKRLIRQAEGASTCSFVNVAGYEFLDPPLYKSGRSKKNPLSQEDIDIVWDVLNKYKPNVVYAAGDLTDPNGTHRL